MAAMLAGVAGAQSGTVGDGEAKVVRVDGDHLEQTVRCEGHAIEIAGSNSRLVVLGPCTAVRVLGNRNFVTVGATKKIVTKGDQNTVEYTERRTRVSDRGKGNTVAEKWPQ